MWTDDSPMPFGKHKGKSLKDVPASYLLWCDEQHGMELSWPQLISYIELNRDDIEDRKEQEKLEDRQAYQSWKDED